MARVLVVDDDQMILRMLKRGLSLDGYEVEVSASASEALQIVRMKKPDLVVLDVMLPNGPDGLATARLLRQQNNTVPILLLTARDTASDRARGFEAGADDFLAKPFAFEELSARLRALLNRVELQRKTSA